ncbi:hypothetical protein CEXT_10491 [Caerostris extrusa]|uniref:Uncharacterized protein n=1 Tax=Caerostris extrusa TaxID=172846 RepID=A0AAV4MNT7_CAEEX|nr:hypothetical protein CEXT_10491 [Caerostris extrusa]
MQGSIQPAPGTEIYLCLVRRKRRKKGGIVHLERAKIEQKSSATFLLSEKPLMKMDEGVMGNFLTRHSNERKRKNEPKEDGKRKEEKNVSQISNMYIYPVYRGFGYIHL